ncbi:hypothetical protein BDZ88DRAFT_128389 [Geranomyces variabilis]|nr:hypothetical protein BDZ88DRAFT_128389 [Geranomyces variabilis]KAJ3135313.1 hypothetical protein HDU90_004037 [Geranomyces variabilis]
MESDEQRLQRIRLAKERIMQKKANQGRTDGSGGPQASIPPSRQRTQPPSRQPSQPPTRRPSQQQIYHHQAPPPQQYHQQHQQYNDRRPSQASSQQQQLLPTGRSPHPPPSPAVKPATTPKSAQPLPSPAKTPPERPSAQSDVRDVSGQAESLQMTPAPPQGGFEALAASRSRTTETPPLPPPPQSGFEASAFRGRANETPPIPPPSQKGFEAAPSHMRSAVTSPFAYSTQQSVQHFATDHAPHEETSVLLAPPQQSDESSAASPIVSTESAALPPPPPSGLGAPPRPPTSNDFKSLPPPPQSGFGAPAPPVASSETAAISPPPQSGIGAPTPPVMTNERQPLPPPPQSGFVAPPQGGFVPRASSDGQSKIPPRGGFVPRASFDATSSRSRFEESHHPRHRFHDINAQSEQGDGSQSAERLLQPTDEQPSPRSKEQPAAQALSAAAVVNNPRAFLGGIFSSVVETLATGSDVVASGIEQALRKTPALANHNPSTSANAKRQGTAVASSPERESTPAQEFSYEQFAGGANGESNGFDSVSLNNPSSAISADFAEVPLAGGQLAGFSRPNDGFDAVLFEDQSFAATPPPPLAESSRPDSVLDDLLPATLQAEQETERPVPAKVASGVDLASSNAGSPWLESSVYSDGNPVVAADEVGITRAPEPASEWLPAQPAPAIFGARPSSGTRASPYTDAGNLPAGSPTAGGARQAATNDTPHYGSFDDATFEVGPDFIPDALPSDVHESRISPTPASEIKPGTPVFTATGLGTGRPAYQSELNVTSSPATASVASAAPAVDTPHYASDTVASAFAPVQSFDFGPSSYGAQDFVITSEDSQASAASETVPYATHKDQVDDPIANAFGAQASAGTAYGTHPYSETAQAEYSSPQNDDPVANSCLQSNDDVNGGYGSPQHADTFPAGSDAAHGSYTEYPTQDADTIASAFGGASYGSYGQDTDPVVNAFGAQQNMNATYGSYGQDAYPVTDAFGAQQNAEAAYGSNAEPVAKAFGTPQSADTAGVSYGSYGQDADPIANAFGGHSEPVESYGSYGQDADPVANIFGAPQNADPAANPVANPFNGQPTPGESYGSYGQDANPVGNAFASCDAAYGGDADPVANAFGSQPSADASVDPVTSVFGMLSVSGNGQDSVTSAFGSQPSAYPADTAQGPYGQEADPVTSAFGTQSTGQEADPVISAFGYYGQQTDPVSKAFGSRPSADATQGSYDQEVDPLTKAFGSPSNDDPIANAFGVSSSPAGAQRADSIANAFGLPATSSSSHGAYGQQVDPIANAFGSSSTPAGLDGVYGQQADPIADAFSSQTSAAGSLNMYSQQADPIGNAFGSQARRADSHSAYGLQTDPIVNAFGLTSPAGSHSAYSQQADPIANAFGLSSTPASAHSVHSQQADPVSDAFGLSSSPAGSHGTYGQQADPVSSAFGSQASPYVTHGTGAQHADPVANAFGLQSTLSSYEQHSSPIANAFSPQGFGTRSYGAQDFVITSEDTPAPEVDASSSSAVGESQALQASAVDPVANAFGPQLSHYFGTSSYGAHDFAITSDDPTPLGGTAFNASPYGQHDFVITSDDSASDPNAQPPVDVSNAGSYGTHDFSITSDDLPSQQETSAYGLPTSEPSQYGAGDAVTQQPAQTPLEAFSLPPSEYPVAAPSDKQDTPFVSGMAQQEGATAVGPSHAPRYDPKELDDLMRANEALRSRFAQMMARLPASLLATAAH